MKITRNRVRDFSGDRDQSIPLGKFCPGDSLGPRRPGIKQLALGADWEGSRSLEIAQCQIDLQGLRVPHGFFTGDA